jgi:hypothetical protein
MEILGPILGWTLVALTLWAILATLVKIQKDVGLLSPTGLPWMVVVIVGSLFGVVLYRWFREPIEEKARKLFRYGVCFTHR